MDDAAKIEDIQHLKNKLIALENVLAICFEGDKCLKAAELLVGSMYPEDMTDGEIIAFQTCILWLRKRGVNSLNARKNLS